MSKEILVRLDPSSSDESECLNPVDTRICHPMKTRSCHRRQSVRVKHKHPATALSGVERVSVSGLSSEVQAVLGGSTVLACPYKNLHIVSICRS